MDETLLNSLNSDDAMSVLLEKLFQADPALKARMLKVVDTAVVKMERSINTMKFEANVKFDLSKVMGLDEKKSKDIADKYEKLVRRVIGQVDKSVKDTKFQFGDKDNPNKVKLSDIMGVKPEMSFRTGLKYQGLIRELLGRIDKAASTANFKFSESSEKGPAEKITLNDVFGSKAQMSVWTNHRYQTVLRSLLGKINKAAKDAHFKFGSEKNPEELTLSDVFNQTPQASLLTRLKYQGMLRDLIHYIDKSAKKNITFSKEPLTIPKLFGMDPKANTLTRIHYQFGLRTLSSNLFSFIEKEAKKATKKEDFGKAAALWGIPLQVSSGIGQGAGAGISGVFDKLIDKIKSIGSGKKESGMEEVFTKAQEVQIIGIDKKVIKQLRGEEVKDKKGDVDKKVEEKTSFLKKALKFVGIAALMGLVAYLAKNPEVLEKAKVFFKEKFFPWLKEFVTVTLPDFIKKIPDMLQKVWKIIKDVGGFINKWVIQPIIGAFKWFKQNWDWLWDGIKETWKDLKAIFTISWETVRDTIGDIVWAFKESGKWIGEKAYEVWEWINKYVVTPFIDFGKWLGESIWKVWDWIDQKAIKPLIDFGVKVWDGVKDMAAAIKNTILAIPDFLKEKFETIKTRFIDMIKKIPGVGRLIERGAEKQKEEEALLKRYELHGSENFTSKELKQLKKIQKERVKAEEADDFIIRPGQPLIKFNPQDTVVGAKPGGPLDKMLDVNGMKDLNLYIQELKKTMEQVSYNTQQLVSLQSELIKVTGKPTTRGEPLDSLGADAGNSRTPANGRAYELRTRAWEIIHGVT